MSVVDEAVAAWSAWEAAVASRARVADLDDALAPIAELHRCTVSDVRSDITARLRDGCSVRQAVQALTIPDLFDDDGTPWAVDVTVGSYL